MLFNAYGRTAGMLGKHNEIWFSQIGTSPNGKEAAPPRSITAYVSYHF